MCVLESPFTPALMRRRILSCRPSFSGIFVLTMRPLYQPVYQKNNISIRILAEHHFQPFF